MSIHLSAGTVVPADLVDAVADVPTVDFKESASAFARQLPPSPGATLVFEQQRRRTHFSTSKLNARVW